MYQEHLQDADIHTSDLHPLPVDEALPDALLSNVTFTPLSLGVSLPGNLPGVTGASAQYAYNSTGFVPPAAVETSFNVA